MILEVFTVFDQKSLTYSNPAFYINDKVALREFMDLANSDESLIGKHPEDYVLMLLGTWNDVSGKIDPLLTPRTIGKAIQYVNRPRNLKENSES